MYFDYHLHSEFSDDSTELMKTQIKQAIKLGVDEICFTEHVDYGIKRDFDDTRGIETKVYHIDGEDITCILSNCDYPNYFKKLHEMKTEYSNQISIKQGLEFGVQSHTINEYNLLFDKYKDELDFILFSMHQVNDKESWNQEAQYDKTQKQYNDEYYEEILKCIKVYKNYSVLAHLDMIVRYDLNGPYPFKYEEEIIREILKIAINDNKGIEVNTSSYRYHLKDTTPSIDILKLYKELNGQIISVGSDAHKKEDLGAHIKETYDLLRDLGFEYVCTFDKMKPIYHKL